MKKYAYVANNETKICLVGLGTDTEYYKSLGFTEQEVEFGYDGNWYLLGYAPVKPEPEPEEEQTVEEVV